MELTQHNLKSRLVAKKKCIEEMHRDGEPESEIERVEFEASMLTTYLQLSRQGFYIVKKRDGSIHSLSLELSEGLRGQIKEATDSASESRRLVTEVQMELSSLVQAKSEADAELVTLRGCVDKLRDAAEERDRHAAQAKREYEKRVEVEATLSHRSVELEQSKQETVYANTVIDELRERINDARKVLDCG